MEADLDTILLIILVVLMLISLGIQLFGRGGRY